MSVAKFRETHREISQDDVAFEVISAQIELLQRRIAEVDPRAVLLFQSILPIELVLE
jgi:hypothetical protein